MTRREPVRSLTSYLIEFFEFAEEAYVAGESALEPIFHITTCWDQWWCKRDDQEEIERVAAEVRSEAQEEFVTRLQHWLAQKHGAGGAVFVLLQLSTLPLFTGWRSLERLASVPWINVLAVKREKPVAVTAEKAVRVLEQTGMVFPVSAFLRARTPNQPFIKHSPDLDLSDAELREAREAVLSLLSGSGLVWLIVLSALSGWSSARRWIRWAAVLGWLSVASGIGVLILFGRSFEHGLAVGILSVVLPIATVLAPFHLMRCLRELAFARRLARLVSQSQICVFSGGVQTGTTFAPVGSSYCLALAVAICSTALDAVAPAPRSWIWGRFAERLRAERQRWAFTGVLSRGGWIGKVDEQSMSAKLDRSHMPPMDRRSTRPESKYQAALADPVVTELGMPVQNPELPAVTPKPAPAPTRGDPDSSLRLHRRRHLSTLVLDLAGVPSRTATLTSILGLVCLSALAFATADIQRIFFPPKVPKTVPWKCEEIRYIGTGGHTFAFVVETDAPEAFFVRLSSHLQEGVAVPFRRDIHFPAQAVAEIPMAEARPAREKTVKIQVLRPQSFLKRPLKDVVVLVEDFEGLRRAAEDERSLYLR